MNTIIQIFKSFLEISILASMMIIAVLMIRTIAKDRISLKVISFLWFLIILRLCIPGMLESPIHIDSLFPAAIENVEQVASSDDSLTPEYTQDAITSSASNYTLPASETMPSERENTANELAAVTPTHISAWGKIINFFQSFDLWATASFLWIIGALVVLLMAIRESLAFGFYIKKNSRPIKVRTILGIVNSQKNTNRIKRTIRVSSCPSIHMPLVIGVVRPHILLPSNAFDLEPKYLYTILLHEMCHIKRNDILKNYVCVAVKALHWFNPLVWIGIAKMKEDMEFSCDQRVFRLLNGEQKILYCESLVQATRLLSNRKVPQIASSLYEEKSNLKKRIVKMISPRKKSKFAVAIALILAIVMLFVCFTTACQPTPEDVVIIQKDNFEELIENTAQPTSLEESEDAGIITWEDTITNDYSDGSSTKVTVSVNASLDIQSEKACVYMVEPGEYDLAFAQKAVDYFLGDEYYDDVYTKEDYLRLIVPLQEAIPQMEDVAETKKDVENLLEFYQRQYNLAPEDNAAGEIAFETARFEYIGLKGYPRDGAVSELYVGNGGMGYTNFYYVIQDGTKEYSDTNYAYSGTPARQMETSYADAIKIANDAIYNLYGENMSLVQTDLYNVYAIDSTYINARKGLLDNSCPQCYMFTFTPIYGGLPQLYAPEAKNEDDLTSEGVAVYEQKWDYEYSMKWPAQYVQVLVDDSGIVEFWGFSPTKITATINENVAVESFDDIFERFKKNIFYSSIWSYNGLEEVNINIDKIVFGMIRVPVKDNPDAYYMIPAWQFVGSKEEVRVSLPDDLPAEVKESSELYNYDYSESGKTFLVLNALDGSIIDTSYYMNVRGDLEKTIGVSKD